MQSKKYQRSQENSLGKVSKILDVLLSSRLFCGVLIQVQCTGITETKKAVEISKNGTLFWLRSIVGSKIFLVF